MEMEVKKVAKKTFGNGWLILPIFILAIPLVGVILAFLLGISPLALIGFLGYKYYTYRLERHRMNLKYKYQLKLKGLENG